MEKIALPSRQYLNFWPNSQTTNSFFCKIFVWKSLQCLVINCSYFGTRHSPYYYFKCRVSDIAAVRTIFNVFNSLVSQNVDNERIRYMFTGYLGLGRVYQFRFLYFTDVNTPHPPLPPTMHAYDSKMFEYLNEFVVKKDVGGVKVTRVYSTKSGFFSRREGTVGGI